MKKFNKNFLLGAATAAHQVEGNNKNSDCWAMEHMKFTTYTEPSLDAVDHYNRYEEDIKLMANAGLNCYRFSIEWARIQPLENQFDENEVEHYLKVIECCKENKIEPIITLHHFSSPKWIISKGGWEAETIVADFEKYARYIVSEIGDKVKYICTINEANMGIQVARIAERYKRQMMAQAASESNVQMGLNLQKMMESQQAGIAENFEVFGVEKLECFTSPRTEKGDILVMKAHKSAKNAIKSLFPNIKVGLSLSLHDIQPVDGGEEIAKTEWEEEFSHYLSYIKDDDFLGVQNYTRSIIGADGIQPNPKDAELTQMGYEFYPVALENVIRKVAIDFKGELMVTENGIATADDSRRVEFIKEALSGVQNCINDGINVTGYMYWSLLDNFEWQKGYSMTFGLISVDRTTQRRAAKESLRYLGSNIDVNK